MRQSKFTGTQIVSILQEADAGCPINEIWRSYSISSATYYKWKAKYGGMEAFDIRRLKELEHENSCLKRLYADLSLGECGAEGCHRKKALRSDERREPVPHMVTEGGLPVHRACAAVGLGRVAYYRPLVDWARHDARVIVALTILVAA